jgi:hypothetical protein
VDLVRSAIIPDRNDYIQVGEEELGITSRTILAISSCSSAGVGTSPHPLVDMTPSWGLWMRGRLSIRHM